jgi:hypothetical protein
VGQGTGVLIDLLRGGLTVRVEVTGHSMAPFVRGGDVVTIAPCRRLSLGDVVAFTSDGRLTVHRIVEWTDSGLLARGDVAPSADPPFTREEVLGVVTAVERGGRRVRLGLGLGSRAVAWLSRHGWLRRLARVRARWRGAGLPEAAGSAS